MSCGRAEGIELDAFLLAESGRDEAIDAFRSHYPSCAECAAVVADWMAIDAGLREVLSEQGERVTAHPDPDDLARYAEAPARMGETAMQIQRHLTGCASCANEFRLIRGFDPAVFGAPREASREPAPLRRPTDEGLLGSLRTVVSDLVERVRGFELLSPAPALALALVVVLGLWATGAFERLLGRSDTSPPQIVEQPAPPATDQQPLTPGPEPSGALPGVTGIGAPVELAQEEPPAGREDRAPSSSPAPAPAPAPVELAQARPEPTPSALPPSTPKPNRPAEPKPSPTPSVGRDEVVLAAVNDLPPPDYATPSGSDSLVWMRQFGAVRSAPSEAHVAARAPRNHTGVTLSRTPRLWWSLDKATDHPIQITVDDGQSIEPLVRVELPGPHRAGLHAFDLAGRGVALSPDIDYRWFVAVVVDPDRPSRNPISVGSLRVAGSSDARRATITREDASARGNKFAELGLWYDAFDFYATLAEAHPEMERLAAYRDRLGEVSVAKP